MTKGTLQTANELQQLSKMINSDLDKLEKNGISFVLQNLSMYPSKYKNMVGNHIRLKADEYMKDLILSLKELRDKISDELQEL